MRKLEEIGFDEVFLNWVELVWNNVLKFSFCSLYFLEIKLLYV